MDIADSMCIGMFQIACV